MREPKNKIIKVDKKIVKITTIDCHKFYRSVTQPSELLEALGKDKIHYKPEFMERMVIWAENEIPPFYHTISTDNEEEDE